MKNIQEYERKVSTVIENCLLGYGLPIDIQTGQYAVQSIQLIEWLVKRQLERTLPTAKFEVAVGLDERYTANLKVKMYVGDEYRQLEFVERGN